MEAQKRVAIIGAGISGLAAAHRLRELDSRSTWLSTNRLIALAA